MHGNVSVGECLHCAIRTWLTCLAKKVQSVGEPWAREESGERRAESGEQEGRPLDGISSLDRWKVANVLTGEWQCESNGAATEVTRCVRRRCEE